MSNFVTILSKITFLLDLTISMTSCTDFGVETSTGLSLLKLSVMFSLNTFTHLKSLPWTYKRTILFFHSGENLAWFSSSHGCFKHELFVSIAVFSIYPHTNSKLKINKTTSFIIIIKKLSLKLQKHKSK